MGKLVLRKTILRNMIDRVWAPLVSIMFLNRQHYHPLLLLHHSEDPKVKRILYAFSSGRLFSPYRLPNFCVSAHITVSECLDETGGR
jgi:hypothetical protein